MTIGHIQIVAALIAAGLLVISGYQVLRHATSRRSMSCFVGFRSVSRDLYMARRLYEGKEISGKSLILCGPSGVVRKYY